MHVDSTTTRVNYFHTSSYRAVEDARRLISPACFCLPKWQASTTFRCAVRVPDQTTFRAFTAPLKRTASIHSAYPFYRLLALTSIFLVRCPPQAGVQLLCLDSPLSPLDFITGARISSQASAYRMVMCPRSLHIQRSSKTARAWLSIHRVFAGRLRLRWSVIGTSPPWAA